MGLMQPHLMPCELKRLTGIESAGSTFCSSSFRGTTASLPCMSTVR